MRDKSVLELALALFNMGLSFGLMMLLARYIKKKR
jgi:hypothetical protein